MNLDRLKEMTPEALRELALKQGLTPHWKAKPETIIKQIVDHVTMAKPQEMQHVAETPKSPVFHNTPEEVEAMLAEIKARVPAFESKYDLTENTWHFRCKGAEECGNLDIPMRVIKMKAQTISRGKLTLMGLNDHFDKGNAGGNSAYTNNVLAG